MIGSSPEQSSEEPRLSEVSRATEAGRLFSEFQEVLRQSPEFSRFLVESYFDLEEQKLKQRVDPIKIQRGSYKYNISYRNYGREIKSLIIDRWKTADSGTVVPQDIVLLATGSGGIEYLSGWYHREDRLWVLKDGSTNLYPSERDLATPTAVEKVEAFLEELKQTS